MTPGRLALAKVAIRGMGSNQHASCPGESPWQDIKPVVLGSSGAPPALLRRLPVGVVAGLLDLAVRCQKLEQHAAH